MYDIRKGRWSRTISDLLDVPQQMLPEVKDSAADFGTTDPEILGGAIPILGVAGDQQAATIGQACFQPGMMKSTYGNRLLCPVEHRGCAGGVQEPDADHHRLPAGRQAHIRVGRFDFYCRCCSSMAARRGGALSNGRLNRVSWPCAPIRDRT